MVRKAANKVDHGWRPSNDYQNSAVFIQYELTKEDVAVLKREFVPKFETAAAIISLVSDGYKITFKWDDRNDCASVFLFPPPNDKTKSGLVLTGRGSTANSALIEVCFKHWTCFDTNWPTREDAKKSKSWDDSD